MTPEEMTQVRYDRFLKSPQSSQLEDRTTRLQVVSQIFSKKHPDDNQHLTCAICGVSIIQLEVDGRSFVVTLGEITGMAMAHYLLCHRKEMRVDDTEA